MEEFIEYGGGSISLKDIMRKLCCPKHIFNSKMFGYVSNQ
jgi:hypothetical protein